MLRSLQHYPLSDFLVQRVQLFSREEYLFNSAISLEAAAGGSIWLSTISLLVKGFPYSALLSSRSGRNVAPVKARPANTPRDREYDRIWARIPASVCAV